MSLQPDISVIISTYNAPRWLELVLEGYFSQKFSGCFELVIADDGSTQETEILIQKIAACSPVPISHVWQHDDGFQKCRVLNKAVASARGSILLFTDGDCIPQSNMLQVHFNLARPGFFLTGGYLKLPKAVSHQITVSAIHKGLHSKPAWLLKHGFPLSGKLFRLMLPSPLDRLANRITPTKRTWNGHNASCFRKDAVAVNGFNEEMQYGGEDVEFGLRLNHYGVYGRHLRYTTTPVHLHHRHDYVRPEMRLRNDLICKETRKLRRIRAELGLSQWQ